MILVLVGVLLLAWIVIGSMITFLFNVGLAIAVIAGVGYLGVIAYRGLKNSKNRRQIR